MKVEYLTIYDLSPAEQEYYIDYKGKNASDKCLVTTYEYNNFTEYYVDLI